MKFNLPSSLYICDYLNKRLCIDIHNYYVQVHTMTLSIWDNEWLIRRTTCAGLPGPVAHRHSFAITHHILYNVCFKNPFLFRNRQISVTILIHAPTWVNVRVYTSRSDATPCCAEGHLLCVVKLSAVNILKKTTEKNRNVLSCHRK